MDELVRHPKVLDAVESIIGPNILIYHLTSWLKEPHEPSHVSWHQDGTYFGLEPAEQVTAWIALTDSTAEMGCIKILPGSHVIGQKPHKDTSVPGNLLSRGQTIESPAGLCKPCDDAAAGRTDVAAPHACRALLRAEPHGSAPYRYRCQLYPDALPPGQRRAGNRGAGPRETTITAISIRSRGRPAISIWRRVRCTPPRSSAFSNPTSCSLRAAEAEMSGSDLLTWHADARGSAAIPAITGKNRRPFHPGRATARPAVNSQ